MRAWMLPADTTGPDQLQLREVDQPQPGPGEVLVRLRAWSLNYRDLMVAGGNYMGGPLPADAVPLSDGAGEIAGVGAGVTNFREGDRVQSSFFPHWTDGAPVTDVALGDGRARGMLAEYVVLPATGVVPIAPSLSFAEAACLPCAGVTAWNALYEGPRPLMPGMRVLVLGTGGVSTLALAIAKAGGCEVFATSSQDAKLAKMRDWGADRTVNYKTTPEWGAWAKELGGVDKVIEVGGAGTAQQSMSALRTHGEVAFIGVLDPEGGPNPRGLMMSAGTMRGIFVGSAAMARRLNAAVEVNGIRPMVGRSFAFTRAPDAYAHAAGPDSIGKTVIELA